MLGVLCHFARFRVQSANPLGNRAVRMPTAVAAIVVVLTLMACAFGAFPVHAYQGLWEPLGP
ncbi:hypothetical protein OG930_44575 [Streptomyces sp. NBC_01799]|nr:hypothetical protein OG930_00885 [Streptomyces sp. NBC_01799]WSA81932.1 hypothetical protein OG930_44575 [Streptomyces sp. NBC_01799]